MAILAVFTSAPGAPAESLRRDKQPVAIFWVGEEPLGVIPVDVRAIRIAYESRGYRVVQADRLEPEAFRELLLADRNAHPEDYQGTEIPLIVHGRGAVPSSAALPPGTVLDLGREATRTVRDEELIVNFLIGIGQRAKGHIISSQCFQTRSCRDVELEGTPFARRVTRLLVAAAPPPERSPGQAATPEERVMRRLLDSLVERTRLGARVRQRESWTSAGPLAELERAKLQRGPDPVAPPLAVQAPALVPPSALLQPGKISIDPAAAAARNLPRPPLRERLGLFK